MAVPIPLDPGEAVLLCQRRHWATFWPSFAVLLLVAALPAGFALGLLSRTGFAGQTSWRFAMGAAVLWIGFWLTRAILHRRRHERIVYVITSLRVVAVSAAGPFHFATSATALSDIREVSAEVRGVAATMLRFGTVEYGTGDGSVRMQMHHVAQPQHVALILQRACRDSRSPALPRGD